MNWAEVFAAIQAGTVDGAICCTAQSTYTVFALSDVGKYFIPYNAFVEASTYDASKKSWEKLDEKQQTAVQAAVDRAAASRFGRPGALCRNRINFSLPWPCSSCS